MSAFLFGETNVSRLTEATSAAAALRSKGGNSQSSSSASKARRASASAASASTDLFDLDQLRLLGRRRSQQEDTVRPRQGHLRKARLSQSGTLGSPLPSLAAQGPPPVCTPPRERGRSLSLGAVPRSSVSNPRDVTMIRQRVQTSHKLKSRVSPAPSKSADRVSSALLPPIASPSLPWQPAPKPVSQFLQCSQTKPLHQRDVWTSHPRVPPEKVYRLVKRQASNCRVIRVGGGYLILSDDWEAFFAHRDVAKSLSNEDYVPAGMKILQRLEDGTIILEDGSRILPDGTRVFADGSRLSADGTWLDENGNPIADPDVLARLRAAHPDAYDEFGRPKNSRGNIFGSRFEDGDLRPPGSRGKADASSANRSGRGLDPLDPSNADTSGASGQANAGMSRHSRRGSLSWDYDQEVVEVLPDGTRVLADGTRIHPDGSITLADGTHLSPEEAHELAMKRKHGNLPKPRRKRVVKDSESSSSRGGKGDRADGDSSSEDEYDEHGNLISRGSKGHKGKKGDIYVDSDGEEWEVDEHGNRRRRRRMRLDSLDSARKSGSVSSYFPRDRKGVNALDYLSRYCILSEEQLRQYRIVFNNLDRDQDGEISLIELDFGLKTVNKHLISKQELDYVQVVLDVHQASAINFRMFAVVAALSERVVDLDMLVKGLINAMDARALANKLAKCKDLFYLLDEKKLGIIDVEDLGHELQAGRISQEHEDIIIDKFTENGKEHVDFLDFLTYIPLFLEIHDTITDNPFEVLRNK